MQFDHPQQRYNGGVKPGDLITLCKTWNTYPLELDPHGKLPERVDTLLSGDLALVLNIDAEYTQVLSPRGIVGWIWNLRVKAL